MQAVEGRDDFQVPQRRTNLRVRQFGLYVQDGVYDAFCRQLVEAVRKLESG